MRAFYEDWFAKSIFFNRTTSHFEARLVYMHTQKPKKLISNAILRYVFTKNCVPSSFGTTKPIFEISNL